MLGVGEEMGTFNLNSCEESWSPEFNHNEVRGLVTEESEYLESL